MRRRALAAAAIAVAAGAYWLGYDHGYSSGWGEALFYADTVDMELRGVKP